MLAENLAEPTMAHLLYARATTHRDRQAFAYLADGETVADSATFGELLARSETVAAWLRRSGASGTRVLLLHENPLNFIAALFGCVLANAVAVPAYSPVGKKQVARIGRIVNDSGATFALTDKINLEQTRAAIESFELELPLVWCGTDALTDQVTSNEVAEHALPEADALAVLQYTSGSTNDPKGVMLTHANFMQNLETIRGALGGPVLSDDIAGVFWLPLHHDMGLVGAVLTSVYLAASSELMAPISFVINPVRWLRRISGKRNVITAAPNFAHELCVTTTTPEERAALDLSGWRTALCGAEFVHLNTMDRFAEAFAPAGFRHEALQPVYGLAEGTLLVSGSPRAGGPLAKHIARPALEERRLTDADPGAPGTAVIVGCGRIQEGTTVVIVEPDTHEPCPAGRIGEIWMASGSVAQGYWRQPEATAEAFHAQLTTSAGYSTGPYLRTGDLGFIADNELFIAGRLKDMVIVRGRNLYPDDLETTIVGAHPLLLRGRGAVFAIDGNGGSEELVVVQELVRDFPSDTDFDAICRDIAAAVTEHHDISPLTIVLVNTYSLPSTSSGKVQRFACRNKYNAGELKVVAEWSRSRVVPTTDGDGGQPSVPALSTAEIQQWLIEHLASAVGVQSSEIDPRESFAYYGLDSIRAVQLSNSLSEQFDLEISPTVAYEYPSIETLSAFLASGVTVQGEGKPERFSDSRSGDTTPQVDDPIAIVGIGCRFPGADGPEAFWNLIHDGVDAVGEVPGDRWSHDDVRFGGFLNDVRGFDAQFFGISAREAEHIDPQQRLLLEVAWEALADAGIDAADLAGEQVGVYVGVSTNDYGRMFYRSEDRIDAYAGTGNALSVAANRVSYYFDFRGPSVAIDTACSSSLVALHLATSALRSGDATLALVGGVNVLLSPDLAINMTKAGVMAADGRCKTFDATADGYVRSEGAGVVVLAPLSQALADGLPVYAVIKGTATNSDGRTNGLMAPSRNAQEDLLRHAYADAGVSPGQVRYVEAHGTGTLLGDSMEANALASVMATGRAPGEKCLIGSVKSNIGHLEAAAGVAGIIKVAKAIQHRTIPPTLHYTMPNPGIDLESSVLRVAVDAEPWTGTVLAGVSSFGFGGTNGHVVLAAPPTSESTVATSAAESRDRLAVLPISAADAPALRSLADLYRSMLETDQSQQWSDIVYSAARRRAHHDHRLAVVASTKAEAVDKLSAYLRGDVRPGTATGRRSVSRRPKIVFVFSGQGSQWLGMGRQLFLHEQVYRESLVACDREIRRISGWSVINELHAPESKSRLEDVDIVQPTLFAVQVAIAELWRSWGVRPDAVVGHSMGEVAAAYVSGALSLADAATVICHRSRLLREVAGKGAMAVVELTAEEASFRLRDSGIAVAALNSPRSTVVSGDPALVDELLTGLEREEVFCRRVKVDVASHGPQMDQLRPVLVASLGGLSPGRESVPMHSTVTGSVIPGEALDADYWGRNLRETVQFAQVTAELRDSGHDVFLEVSPNPVLLGSILDTPVTARPVGPREITALSSGTRDSDERAALLTSLGGLWSVGYPVDWNAQHPDGGRLANLPSYPWQRREHWIEKGSGQATVVAAGTQPVFTRIDSAIHAGTAFWQAQFSRASFPLLAEHTVGSTPTVPPALYVAVACHAAEHRFGDGYELSGLSFGVTPSPRNGNARTVQLALVDGAPETASIQILVAAPDASCTWETLATGAAHSLDADLDRPRPRQPADTALSEELSALEFYSALAAAGHGYGPGCQGVGRVVRHDGKATADLREHLGHNSAIERIAVNIDSACQLLVAMSGPGLTVTGGPFHLAGLDRLRVYGDIAHAHRCHVVLRTATGDLRMGDFQLSDVDGRIVADGSGLRVRGLRVAARRNEIADTLRAATPEERASIVEEYFASLVAERLGVDARELDRDQPMRYMGLDSLGAMKLRSSIELDLPVTISVIKLLEGPSIAEFARWLLDQIGRPAQTIVDSKPSDTESTDDIDALSDEDVDELLSTLLAAKEGNA